MKNLETVVRERNKAYYDLEVGECAERPGQLVTNLLGKIYIKVIKNNLLLLSITVDIKYLNKVVNVQ